MSSHKHIDRLCAAAIVLALLITIFMYHAGELGISSIQRTMGYETRLFDTTYVHTIDIVMDDWDSFIDTCENEEYSLCTVVIDGYSCSNAAIRAKGNTSLSSVSAMGSDRYSFKIEFDHYDSTATYFGLDKLSLNNLIQDNSMMKDYLTYRMMAAFGVAAPLCSFVSISVNGELWGLYLAVEGVEDAFLQRNYGGDSGALYKPDSLSMGGGRGNGMEFDMDDLDLDFSGSDSFSPFPSGGQNAGFSSGVPSDFDPSGFDFSDFDLPASMGGMDSGMGSSDVKLQYAGDDPSDYPNIFDNAKTDVTAADKSRLIAALKTLAEGEDVASAVDIDQVLRYFVVHNYVVNGDSYTGSMVHNYYLYEQDGLLNMIPWDYNLAFGTFQGNDASASVNDPIDTPLSVTGDGDRPMADWIFQSETYTDLYHQYFRDFLDTVDIGALLDEAQALISPYVENDPTRFCTYEEYLTGADALRQFCALRSESVSGQLDGTIPSTDEGQRADTSTLVDASQIDLAAMGTMNNGSTAPGMDAMAIPGNFGGDFSPGEAPSGEMPTGQPGSIPSGEMANGQPGGMPSGETVNGQPGDIPTGETASGQPGDIPTGETANGQPGSMPSDETANSQPDGMPSGSGTPARPGENAGVEMPGSPGQSAGQPGENTPGGAGMPAAALLLVVSVAVLLLGLLFAAKYRR